jgi:hypothetical protein
MYEHGDPSQGLLVVYLSSEDDDVAPDTSRNEDIAHKLFSNLNCGILEPSDDDHVIVISDSEEEKEVRKDDHAEAAPFSLRDSPATSTSAAADDDAHDGVQYDSSGPPPLS